MVNSFLTSRVWILLDIGTVAELGSMTEFGVVNIDLFSVFIYKLLTHSFNEFSVASKNNYNER